MLKTTLICISFGVLPFNALADNLNSAAFTNNGSLNASALGAIIAASNVNFQPAANVNYGGNAIGGGAFAHALGINAVNQNTGANANSQQAISVTIGSLHLGSVSN